MDGGRDWNRLPAFREDRPITQSLLVGREEDRLRSTRCGKPIRPDRSRTFIACSSKFSRPGWSGRLECASRAPKTRKSDACLFPNVCNGCLPISPVAEMLVCTAPLHRHPQQRPSDDPRGQGKGNKIGSDGQG